MAEKNALKWVNLQSLKKDLLKSNEDIVPKVAEFYKRYLYGERKVWISIIIIYARHPRQIFPLNVLYILPKFLA